MRVALLMVLLLALPATAKTCIDCHAGAAERSWALSKHGVIAMIEAGRERRRAPDCAGCHAVEAQAPTAQHYDARRTRARAREAATESCRACHSPRYTTEQNAAAQRGLAIGEMKRREAEALVESARVELAGEQLTQVEKLFANLRDRNLRDLRLGLAHQSPDYQWWLGQAALDGSLLRIKGALGEGRRLRRPTSTAAAPESPLVR